MPNMTTSKPGAGAKSHRLIPILIIIISLSLLQGVKGESGPIPVYPFVTPFMRTVLDDITAAAARATLGITEANDPNIGQFTGLTWSAGDFLYNTDGSTLSVIHTTTAFRSLLNEDPNSGDFMYWNGTDWVPDAISSFILTVLDDATAAAVRSTIGLGSVENTALSTWAGTINITTLGTIVTGIWHGTALTDAYVSDTLTVGVAGSVADAAIPAGITRDIEWDTIGEINTATTDADIIATNSTWAGGDLGGTGLAPSVTDDSHAHTGTTLSGIDISGDTNLSGDTENVLTGDALSIGAGIARDAEVAAGYQPLDADLTDLADGSLTGSKVSAATTGALGVMRADSNDLSVTAGKVSVVAGMTRDTEVPGLETDSAHDNFSELAGTVGDAQIAAGAVDGGLAGEIADGSVTTDDLGTDSVSADELNAAGVESELEAVVDLSDLQGAVTDVQVPDTITLTNITQVTNRSHTNLTNIGTNTHAQIDTQLGAVINIKSHGAVDDGATNCSPAFAAALAALPVDGGIILCPPTASGFKLNTTVSISGIKRIHIKGSGTEILAGMVDGTPLFNVAQDVNMIFEGLNLTGNALCGNAVNGTTAGTNIQVINCRITDFTKVGSWGIRVVDPHVFSLLGSQVMYNDRGVDVNDPMYGCDITDNWICYNKSFQYQGHGGVHNVTGNMFGTLGTAAQNAYILAGGIVHSPVYFTDCSFHFAGNVLDNNANSTVDTNNVHLMTVTQAIIDVGCNGWSIISNRFEQSVGYAGDKRLIYIVGKSQRGEIRGNSFLGTVAADEPILINDTAFPGYVRDIDIGQNYDRMGYDPIEITNTSHALRDWQLIWPDANSLNTMIDGINPQNYPKRKLEVIDSTAAQLRLTHTWNNKFADFLVDTNYDLTITPSSTGQIKLQPTTDQADSVQILDADGGTPIVNVDAINERVGIGDATPGRKLSVNGYIEMATGNAFVNDTGDAADNGYLMFSGGGDMGTTRGAGFYLMGNEDASNPGCLIFDAGNVAGGDFIVRTGASVERFRVKANGNTTVPAADDYRIGTARAIDPNAYGSGWNTSTVASDRNAIYDYLHLFDTNDDGDVDVIDATVWATKQGVLTNSAGLLAALNDETGTGLAVFATSPTLTTPNIGVATATANIKGEPKHLRFTIVDPATAYTKDAEICIWVKVDAAITVTNLEVTCDSDPATEITGDLKYADAFIGLATPIVINDFDTAVGVRSDATILSGAVAAGKCIYISFDLSPIAAITQISFDVTYTYN